MAKRRTKDQKRRATERRLEQRSHQPVQSSIQTSEVLRQAEPAVSTPSSTQSASELAAVLARAGKSKVVTTEDPANMRRFFGFDPQLLYRDLTRTIIISAIILVLLVVFSRLSF